jgi:3-oxoacyl-[acyl-carrier-protein] synthase-3
MAGGKVSAVRVAGIACAVPQAVATVEDLGRTFGEEQSRRIAKSVGVSQRHVSTGGICTSDLCFAAAERLLDEIRWDRSSIDVLVFVSVTPDYVAPATACTLQHRLRLSKACAAFDVSHACSGYVYGLWIVSHLLSAGNAKRALLLVGDTVTRLTSPYDRATAPLFGDGGSATALEWNESAEPMYFEMGSDGGGARHLCVQAGGFRHPATGETGKRTERDGGNLRSDEDLYMNGTEIFAFSIREVPTLANNVLERAGWTLDQVDGVVMHQASLFMMQHLAKKMKVPSEKLIVNLEDYGNTSAASIPLALTGDLAEQLRQQPRRLVLLGFGAGLSWGGVALTCGPLRIPGLTAVTAGDLGELNP